MDLVKKLLWFVFRVVLALAIATAIIVAAAFYVLSHREPKGNIAVSLASGNARHAFAASQPAEAPQQPDYTAEDVIAAINAFRVRKGLQTLSPNTALEKVAQYKADDMLARHYFGHLDPDGNYTWPKITSEGYSFSIAAENLAEDWYDTDSLVNAWINSPEHRKNILNPALRDTGVGIAFNAAHVYIVQEFGTPSGTQTQAASSSVTITGTTTAP